VGPIETGAWSVGDGPAIEPLIQGGSQQGGLRPGTENIAGAVGFGRAAELAAVETPEHAWPPAGVRGGDTAGPALRVAGLGERLRERLVAAVPDVVVVAGDSERASHVLNLCVPGADSEALLMHLDLAGVSASSGSACNTGAVEPSHVLLAMGIPRALAVGAIRFSLGRETTADELDRVAEVFPRVVTKVRSLAGVLARA